MDGRLDRVSPLCDWAGEIDGQCGFSGMVFADEGYVDDGFQCGQQCDLFCDESELGCNRGNVGDRCGVSHVCWVWQCARERWKDRLGKYNVDFRFFCARAC